MNRFTSVQTVRLIAGGASMNLVQVATELMGSGQSTPKITPQDRAILDLKLQRDKLKQYQKKIQVVLERENQIAKSHLIAGDKERALIALRRRKYQQSLLSRTDDQLATLEQLVSTIEFSLVQVSVLHGLKQGNEVLKQIHREMSLESVERLMEETHEAREYQREIGNLLANQLSREEEDAVQAELLELEAARLEPPLQLDERLTSVGDVPILPSAPRERPVVDITQERAVPVQAWDTTERAAVPG